MIIPIDIESKKSSYNIYIEPLKKISLNSNVAIITNPTVAKYHLDNFLKKVEAKRVEVISVPDGEEYKNIDTVLYILDELFKLKYDRKSTLIALGGGVIGDMTGFSASIFLRGIDFIQVPTTLLSQVDASVGGKTGVNNRYGKNLIGTFYQPKAVYIDKEFLKTLPKREFRAGIAEIIKMAVMFDSDFFEKLESFDFNNIDNLEPIIARAVELKAQVVKMDEKESGIRAVLNYGHTFAHVIEKEGNYKEYLHGEAVAIGMVMANNLANKIGLLSLDDQNRIKNLLKKLSLPIDYKIKDVDKFYESFLHDKKSKDGKITFILPNKRIGSYIIKDDIDPKIIKETLKDFAI